MKKALVKCCNCLCLAFENSGFFSCTSPTECHGPYVSLNELKELRRVQNLNEEGDSGETQAY